MIGPTDPNRLYAMSGTLDPAGVAGGPILSTSSSRIDRYGTLSWTTMPEQLQARGISWKVYGDPDGNFGDNVLPVLQAVPDQSDAGRERAHPHLPRDVPGRRGRRHRCRRSRGCWRR